MKPLSGTALFVLCATALTACTSAPPSNDGSVGEGFSTQVEDRGTDFPTGTDSTTTGSVGEDASADGIDRPSPGPVATGTEVATSDTFSRIMGRWAPTEPDCAQDAGTYVIAADEVERPGQSCTVAELIDAGRDSVTAALLCQTGPNRAEERELLRLSVQDDELSVNIVGSENPPTTLRRCP